MVGIVYEVQPEPPDRASTLWFDAGTVKIGLEHRHVDPESLAASYAGDEAALAEIEANLAEGGFTDDGVSFHIVGADDDHEYLRFDAFDREPHYHYIWPSGDHNNVVPFDAVANGNMVDWVRTRLPVNIDDMLTHAGDRHLCAGLDRQIFSAALTLVCNEADRLEAQRRRPGAEDVAGDAHV